MISMYDNLVQWDGWEVRNVEKCKCLGLLFAWVYPWNNVNHPLMEIVMSASHGNTNVC